MKRIVILTLALMALPLFSRDAEAQQFQVVVNADAGVTEISKADLSKIFLKKSRKLPDGTNAKPVDNGSIWDGFNDAVHGRGTSAIESYWQQQIFAGKDVPPEKADSDGAVLDFVRSNPGAIGYVSSGASLGDGVKAVTVSGL